MFEVVINPIVSNLKRLKNEIMDQHNFKIPLESFTIYNYKGLELDTTDVPYLLNNQIIYICLEGIIFTCPHLVLIKINYYQAEYKVIINI